MCFKWCCNPLGSNNFRPQLLFKECFSKRAQFINRANFHIAAALVMNNHCALSCLLRCMVANLNQRINNIVEGMNIVVDQYQLVFFDSVCRLLRIRYLFITLFCHYFVNSSASLKVILFPSLIAITKASFTLSCRI